MSDFVGRVPVPPVLFLLFNRPDTTAKVFEAIAKVKPAQLFVAADGSRPGERGEFEKCQITREIIQRVDWDCEVKTLFHDENLGCKKAVSSAIDWFFEHVEEGIILEDDCLPSDSFFSFCAELLDTYRHDERIMMISGTNLQGGIQRGEASYYFSEIPHIWGWATWRRAWKMYDRDMASLPEFVRSGAMRDVFRDVNVRFHWAHRFISTYEGEVDTWDYQWMYSIFLSAGLSVCPQLNLVSNIGFGLNATHAVNSSHCCAGLDSHEMRHIIHAPVIEPCRSADLHVYRSIHNVGFPSKKPLSRLIKVLKIRRKSNRLLRSFVKRYG